MKKRLLLAIICALCILISAFAVGCDGKEEPSSPKKKDLTLNGVGMSYEKDDYKPMTKIRQLSDIYFPEGLLDTELGMWIYDNENDDWVRTDTEQGRNLFREDKPTFISTHGMGGGAHADNPEAYYAAGYNVLCFIWGAYADENNEHVDLIVDKVWLYDYEWWDSDEKVFREGARWETVDDKWEAENVSNASVIEMYCAYYYDFFTHFPNYQGSSIELFGHSYGGLISIGATSLLTTAYKCGLLDAYMLPDYVTLLDPYFMRCYESSEVEWLGKNTPKYGNIAEIAYQTSLDCQKLGIAIRMFRFTKTVAFPVTMWHFSEDEEGRYQGDFATSYWKFVNNVVYAHLANNTISVFHNDQGAQHNYAWDWYTTYYTGATLLDALATKTEEQAFCFEMDYDVSFARMGIKYNVDLNNTLDNTDDDILYSFFKEYKYDGANNNKYPNSDAMRSENLEDLPDLHGKAKIAGFVYLDQNKNDVMDERIKDHLSGAKVTITNKDGDAVYSVTTTINGYYEFEVEEEGEYTVTVELPKGYEFSSEKTSAEVNIIDAYYQLAMNNFGATAK